MNSQQKNIAKYISDLRRERGFTQAEFAKQLGTSQSAVNRMESGKQNLSMDMIGRISQVLGREVITLPDDSIDFVIDGGKKLSGEISTKVSKNASVSLLLASLLNKGTTTFKNIPRIEEVHRILEVLQSIGVQVRWNNNSLTLKPPKQIKLYNMDSEAATKTRSVIMLLGPLIHTYRQFSIPAPGGCKLGSRTIMPHIYALEEFGAEFKQDNNIYDIKVKPKNPKEVVLYEAGDTVTENVIMAAALSTGKTVIKMASANYMVQELCYFLQELGVKVEGIGTQTLTIHGRKSIKQNVEYSPSEDPIESMLFLAIAITTKSEIIIKRCPIDFLQLELLKLEKMGFQYEIVKKYKAKNGNTNLVDIKTRRSNLTAPVDKIHPSAYPGLNIDNLPFFIPIACVAKGRTLIHDWVYENRALYYTELNKLGANVTMADTHRVYVDGPTNFVPADVTCPPALRPAAIILIGMLAAPGKSKLRNVYSINRGYEDLAQRLQELGADITVAGAV